jgi:hypothetical protein
MTRYKGKNYDAGWRRDSDHAPKSDFIRYELSKEEVAILKSEFLPTFDAGDALISLTSAGYKITVKQDTYNSCVACFVMPPEDDADKRGLVLTGRGSTALSALIEACFKHWHCFDTNWPARADATKLKSWDE